MKRPLQRGKLVFLVTCRPSRCNENRFEGAVPKLQPTADMGIQDPSLEKLLARETQLQQRLEGLSFHKDQDREDQLQK